MPAINLRLPALAAALFLAACSATIAQDPSATPTATTALRSLRISFLPPPLEGTISLGIYDLSGKLVRVLHREQSIDEFEAGDDALRTKWDGKSDVGEDLPAGKYHARGFVVGEQVKSQRIGYFFNDWVTDENSPHVAEMLGLRAAGNELEVEITLSGNAKGTLVCDSATGAVLRLLPELPESTSDELTTERGKFVIERSDDMQALRRLALSASDTAQPPLEWEKKISRHEGFTVENGKPAQFPSAKAVPPAKSVVKLKPNPLENDARRSVEFSFGFNADGSYLQTADGLPLRTISATKNLVRLLIWPVGDKAADAFQDDTAVVEQIRVPNLDEMMAFDCGAFNLP